MAKWVREFQNNFSSDSWHHISGKNNPADHVSRGIDPDELPKLWLTPPSFLFEPKDTQRGENKRHNNTTTSKSKNNH